MSILTRLVNVCERGLRALLVVTGAAWFLAACASPALAQPATWQIGSSPSLSHGTYGSSSGTSVLHAPFVIRRLFSDGDVTLLLPFSCVRGSGTVTIVSGTPVPIERGARTDAQPGRMENGSFGNAPTTSRCGLGDVVVRGRYYVHDERAWTPTIAIRAHVKTPVASAEKGLGTGRLDEGIGIEASRSLPGGMLVMADAGYTVVGKPADAGYRNTWWYDVGVARDVTRSVNVSVFFEEYRSIVPGLVSARDILTVVSLRNEKGWRVQVSGLFGLSDSAPDRGLVVGASRRF